MVQQELRFGQDFVGDIKWFVKNVAIAASTLHF